jgi:spore germination cell wall hydrolase CwlJ-like protein
MRNNKAILDEAARSVRRTFIGSVAGTLTMLAVVGAAGAYGMPENLTAQALSVAMAKFNIKFPATADSAVAVIERPLKVADNTAVAASPVSDVVSEESDVAPKESIVRTVPEVVAAAPAAPAIAAPMIAAPAAPAAPAIAPAVTVAVPAVEAAPVRNPFTVVDPEPAPTVTASVAPSAAPTVAEERPFIAAPMVFEAPKPADAQVLTAMPQTEMVIVAPQPAVAAPAAAPQPAAAPMQLASLSAEPTPEEFPKSVMLTLPLPKPPMQQDSLTAEPSPVEFPKSVMLTLPLPKPPLSPAQRLELQGKDYDKAEKCLAQAIYFEARNEPARGQQAVAQVVLNRVFSPYYPKDVCSVVYQNAHRHLSCQFTFACDGKPETVNEQGAWARANRIATQTLNAKVWLPEVDKATHYHAAYVRPNWIRDMKVMVRYGLHTFYRPRNWGDGSNEAHWGTPANSVKPATVAAKPAPAPANKKVALRKT